MNLNELMIGIMSIYVIDNSVRKIMITINEPADAIVRKLEANSMYIQTKLGAPAVIQRIVNMCV